MIKKTKIKRNDWRKQTVAYLDNKTQIQPNVAVEPPVENPFTANIPRPESDLSLPMQSLKEFCKQWNFTVIRDHNKLDDSYRIRVRNRRYGTWENVAESNWVNESGLDDLVPSIMSQCERYIRKYDLAVSSETI